MCIAFLVLVGAIDLRKVIKVNAQTVRVKYECELQIIRPICLSVVGNFLKESVGQ